VTRPTPGTRPGGSQVVPRPAGWEPGPPAPWTADAPVTLERVLEVVPEHDAPLLPAFPGARHSAVLLALTDGPDGPEVLLTRRSWELRHHRGEISFPGGRMDPGETPTDTAVREAHEEVGLAPDVVQITGELTHLNTVVSRSYIVPKVATVPTRFELRAQTMEVDRVMWVPLREFTRADTYHSERWGFAGTSRVLHFFQLDDETVWGATAHILVDLLSRVAGPGVRGTGGGTAERR
jgi:8-oxo-dGTP pyrophosphatase MutT (NUDIX family)